MGRHLADAGTAAAKLKQLTCSSHPRPLGATVRAALELVGSRPECRQEVFLFTDMTRSSLPDTALEQIAEALKQTPDARMYLVDVGIDRPHNLALGNLRLQPEILTPGESLRLELDLHATRAGRAGGTRAAGQNRATGGPPSTVQESSTPVSPTPGSGLTDSRTLVELYLNDDQGQPIKRGQQWYDWTTAPNTTAGKTGGKIVFELADLTLGTHQGSVRLAAADPLMMDNSRYFTARVHPPARILLAGETDRDTLFVRAALCPAALNLAATGAGSPRPNDSALSHRPSQTAAGQSARFRCQTVPFDRLAETPLEPYDAVGLLDPPGLATEAWQQLADFVEAGGGVGIFLGHRASRRTSSAGAAMASGLLPGKLRRRSREVTYFRPRHYDHPALAELADYAADIPWPIYPVLQFWEFGALAEDTQVIARYANHQPALLGRLATNGRVLTMTTPFSDPKEPAGRETWNLLPTGPEPWPFVMLANSLFDYLSQESGERTMFQAGEMIRIPLASRQHVSSFVLQQPDGQALRQTLPPGQNAIQISTAETLGNYRLLAGGKSHTLDRGFSINAPADSSLLARVEPAHWASLLPTERVHLAHSLAEIQQQVDLGRTGRELFPWAFLLVVLVWGSEHLLANRFYLGSS